MSLSLGIYAIIHYRVMEESSRKYFHCILEILRTNVLLLVTFYYLKMASEELFTRQRYLLFKRTILIFYSLFMIFMCIGGIKVYFDIKNGTTSDEMCINMAYLSFRWGPLLASLLLSVISICIWKTVSKLTKKVQNKQGNRVSDKKKNSIY